MRDSPEVRLASLIVDRHDLVPPIDIRALVDLYADVEFCEWPHDCDGVAILSGRRPRVFIRSGQPGRRERFTLAHELGHAIIGWHIDTVMCEISAVEQAELIHPLGVNQEGEANRFASHLLVPDRFLEPVRNAYIDLCDVMDLLSQADVSAAAGMISVSRALLPGYVFIVPGLDRPVVSSGTRIESSSPAELSRIAIRAGVKRHQGVDVQWFQLADAVELKSNLGTQEESTELLGLAIREVGLVKEEQRIVHSVNGVVGAALSRLTSNDVGVVHGLLRHRFQQRPGLGRLVATARFEDFMRAKAVRFVDRRKT